MYFATLEPGHAANVASAACWPCHVPSTPHGPQATVYLTCACLMYFATLEPGHAACLAKCSAQAWKQETFLGKQASGQRWHVWPPQLSIVRSSTLVSARRACGQWPGGKGLYQWRCFLCTLGCE